ncbi:hypothetical protein EC80586_2063, partial [Escherichia coli 8.0586]
ARCDM